MIPVVYPPPQFKIKKEGDKQYLFDNIRKTWLLLTKEEWVRQNFIAFLIQELHYPPALISLEKELLLGELKKRFDVLVYNKNHQPWMLIECKATDVSLNEKVVDQIVRYHMSIPVPFMVITNGNTTIGWQKIEGELKLLPAMPVWEGEMTDDS